MQLFTGLSALMGIAAFFATFAVPSEERNAFWMGYSKQRLLLGAVIALGILFFALLWLRERKNGSLQRSFDGFARTGDRVYFIFIGLQCLLFAALWLFQFSWLFVPKNLRPALLWAAGVFALAAFLFHRQYNELFREGNFREKYRLLPSFSDLSGKQRGVLAILIGMSLLYILVLMPSNLNGSKDWAAFQSYSGDEFVMFPILKNVLTPGNHFSETLYHHYIYEDYHYGYPFYAWSSIILSPLFPFFGTGVMEREHISVTLPILRVMGSVVPLMAGCLILVFLFTRFRSRILSPAVYLFLLTAPGSLQNNQGFWHPDGLNLFFICCALYFLQRDRYRFGRNFFAAAFFAGLSAATRLYGFFFFLAIGVYLLSGLIRKILNRKRMLLSALGFILLMGLTILWADPFILKKDALEKMLAIMAEKTGEMSSGYNADFNDPRNDYRPGWDAWYPAFEDHYTEMFCFFFLIGSLLFSCFYGDEQLAARFTFLWWIVVSVYLIWFVAVKSTQYVLPMMLPLMSCIFNLPSALKTSRSSKIRLCAQILSWGIYIAQLIINLIKIAPRFY